MSGDRWERIEALYHEALGRAPEERGAFLEDACRDDAALKAELRSLLECGEASDEFLERPALEDEAKSLAGELGSLLGERDLGGYEILSLLGAGGMGEVYRARDRKLGREAAIKVLARADAGGSESAPPIRGGGASRLGPQPPEHRHDLRGRSKRKTSLTSRWSSFGAEPFATC